MSRYILYQQEKNVSVSQADLCVTFGNDFASMLARRTIILKANFNGVITYAAVGIYLQLVTIADDKIILLLAAVTERLSVSKQVGREAGRAQPSAAAICDATCSSGSPHDADCRRDEIHFRSRIVVFLWHSSRLLSEESYEDPLLA